MRSSPCIEVPKSPAEDIVANLDLGAGCENALRFPFHRDERRDWSGGGARAFACASECLGVSPHDPVSFAAVVVLLALVALIAILIPARSAMKTGPMTALRWE